MKLIECKSCKEKISKKAQSCPNCGEPKKRGGFSIIFIFAALAVIFFLIDFDGASLDEQVARDINKMEMQVAEDAIAQYEIAKRHGNKIDICLAAKFVAVAFLQAENEARYKNWKITEGLYCD